MEIIQIPSTRGARFYNLPDKDIWINEKRLVKTDRQEPSVTTKLSVWPKGRRFYEWFASQPSLKDAEIERDIGGERGTRVHEAIENIQFGDKYGFIAYADEYFGGNQEAAAHEWTRIMGFEDWYNDYGCPEVVNRRSGVSSIECELYSWEHGYGGTTDAVYTGGVFGSRKVMVDDKTSKQLYLSFNAQLAAYFWAWHEMEEEKLDAIAGLRLYVSGKGEPKYQFEMIEDKKEIQEYFEDFLACSRLWKRHRQAEKQSTTERTVHSVRSMISIGKISERQDRTSNAWDPPDKVKEVPKKEATIPTKEFTCGIDVL